MVNAVSKSEVTQSGPADVKGVRLVKATLVSVRRPIEDVKTSVSAGISAPPSSTCATAHTFGYLQRGLKAKHFLNRCGYLVEVVAEPQDRCSGCASKRERALPSRQAVVSIAAANTINDMPIAASLASASRQRSRSLFD